MVTCSRCKFEFDEEENENCGYCGKHKDRLVKRRKRRRPIGGKRGKNSGKVNKAKAK